VWSERRWRRVECIRLRGRGWDDESGISLHSTPPRSRIFYPRTHTRPRPLYFSTYADYYLINSVYYDCYLYARYFHGESYAYGPVTEYSVERAR